MRWFVLWFIFVVGHAYAAESCEIEESGFNYLDFSISKLKQERAAFNCFVDWQAVKHSKIHYQWIDIRSEHDFSTVHINGSINVPSHVIKTKKYLKQRPLLIIDHGASYRRLWRLCSELKQAGFEQVKILKGGINTAVAEGYAVNGTTNTAELLTITPKMAMEEFYLEGTFFVVPNEKMQQRLLAKNISAQLIKQKSNSRNFFSESGRVRYQDDDSENALKSIVVIDALADTNYGFLDESKLLSNVYFLEGGMAALLGFLESAEWIKIKQRSLPERFSCKL